MKSYDEIAERILEKYNSRIAEKKRRRGIIMRTAGSVSGVCAAVIVGVAVWHNTTLRDASRVLYQPQKSNVIVVEGTTADSGNADVSEEAAAAPQTVPVQAAEMTAAQTTVTAADAPAVPTMSAAVNDAPLQTAPAQTAPISTAVTVQAVTTAQTAQEYKATSLVNTATQTQTAVTTLKNNDVTITTPITTDIIPTTEPIVTTTYSDNIPSEIYNTVAHRDETSTGTIVEYVYTASDDMINEDKIGSALYSEKAFNPVTNEYVDVIVYEIQNTDIYHAVAVKFDNVKYYCVYVYDYL